MSLPNYVRSIYQTMEKAFPKKGSTPEKERNLSEQEVNIRILSYLYNKEERANVLMLILSNINLFLVTLKKRVVSKGYLRICVN